MGDALLGLLWLGSSTTVADTTGIPFAGAIVEKGLLGIIIVFLLIVIRYQEGQKAAIRLELNALRVEKDAELKASQNARFDDSKAYREGVLAMSEKVHASVEDLAKVTELLERKR